MQALQKKQKTWVLLLLGALLGLAAFLCLYGTAPLDPANDAWIWYGYDETDIHQHYAGWLGFRNSSWQFPLAQADALAYPAGTGVNISFTDSLPWVSVLFKLLAPVLPAQFQWFGLYELAAFILQGVAAALVLGLFLYNLLPLAAGTALFAFSPIMIERAFRHVALSSHYIVLFALYAYLRGRRSGCWRHWAWALRPTFCRWRPSLRCCWRWKTPCTSANCWPPAGCFWAPARPGMRRAWCWVR